MSLTPLLFSWIGCSAPAASTNERPSFSQHPTSAATPSGATTSPAVARSPSVSPPAVRPVDTGPRRHARGTAAKTAGGYDYVVVSDDTMSGIAERFGVCVRDIARANDDNLDVFVGQDLSIKRTTDIDARSAECKESSV